MLTPFSLYPLWTGSLPTVSVLEVAQGRKSVERAELVFYNKKTEWALETGVPLGEWLERAMPRLVIGPHEPETLESLRKDFEAAGLGSFAKFMESETWRVLKENGLLVV